MKRVAIVYIEAGGGHRAAALSLLDVCRQQRRDWQIDLVNSEDAFAPIDPAYLLLRRRWSGVYNWFLRHGFTRGSGLAVDLGHMAYRLLHPIQVKLLRRQCRQLRPDLLVSVMPHLNRALYESLVREKPATPMVTILTDFADVPPRFWIEPQPQHYICGTARAVRQAEALGGPGSRVWPVSGMIVHPQFYSAAQEDRAEARRKLGLNPTIPTGVVTYGGYGSFEMLEVARAAAKARTPLQMIFLCGKNVRLVARLKSLRLPYPVHVEGFTSDVCHYMRLGDFFIGKPGPGSISEALALGLPLILKTGPATMVQEQYNIQWVREQGVGIVIPKMSDLPAAIEECLEQPRYADAARRTANRAVFEIPLILEQILNEQPRGL